MFTPPLPSIADSAAQHSVAASLPSQTINKILKNHSSDSLPSQPTRKCPRNENQPRRLQSSQSPNPENPDSDKRARRKRIPVLGHIPVKKPIHSGGKNRYNTPGPKSISLEEAG